jgi:Fe-S-cluster containining protein
VFLSEQDAARLTEALGVTRAEFEALYCRRVPAGAEDRVSLKEKPNFDCIFWNNGCSVYENRPLQCSAFPFWNSILADAETWERNAEDCPGMGKGGFHGAEEIANFLKQRESQPFIQRKRSSS